MNKTERLMKQYLAQNLNKTEKTADCLSQQVLIDYFQQKPDEEVRQNVESHLAGCGFCRSQLNLIFEACKMPQLSQSEEVPQEFIQKAKALLKADKGSEREQMIRKKRIKRNLFLLGASIFFIASFLIPRYFAQCLVVALVLGMRWAFESEGGRTLIMVLDSWRRHSHDDDDEISHRLKDKFKSLHR